MAPILAGLAICVLASAFLSITDSALAHFSHSGLYQLARDEPHRQRITRHLDRRRSYQLTCFVLNSVSNVLFVILLSMELLAGTHTAGHVLAVLGYSLLFVLVVGEVVPRAWGKANADRWLARVFPAIAAIDRAARPLTALLSLITAAVGRLTGTPMEQTDAVELSDEIHSIVAEGEKRGDIEENEKEMIQSIFELHEADAAAIMTPRTDMVCIEADASLDRLIALAIEHGYSRIPVFDDTRDNILGVVHVKDLLKPAAPELTARDVAQKPYFVPETKRVDELLHELRAEQGHMAIVLDEYGGTAGLITLEDILEEIVGEIEDEYDEGAAEPLRRTGDHVVECEASLPIDDLNDALEIRLPEDESYDTVGGFVSAQLGRIPAKDETCTWNDVQFTVLDATERKIDRLRVALLPEAPLAEGE